MRRIRARESLKKGGEGGSAAPAWSRRQAPLGGKFNRKQTGKSDWDEARAVAAGWEAARSLNGPIQENVAPDSGNLETREAAYPRGREPGLHREPQESRDCCGDARQGSHAYETVSQLLRLAGLHTEGPAHGC